MGPGVVAAVGKLSQEEEGELGLQSLVVGGAHNFFVDIWGLAANEWESPTKMLEREIMCLMSVALALPVAVKCCPGFPGCFPEGRPWLRSLGAVVIRHSLHVMSSEGRAHPGCP